MRPARGSDSSEGRLRLLPTWLPVTWVLFAFLLLAGALVWNETARRDVLEKWRARLSLAASDYAAAVESWIGERRQDANIIASYPTVRYLVEHATGDPRPFPPSGPEAHARELFDSFLEARGLLAIWAIDAAGSPVGSSSGAPTFTDLDRREVQKALRGAEGDILDFHLREGQPCLAFLWPVRGEDGHVSGAVMIAARPEKRLFAGLARRVLGTRSDQIFLVRRREGRVEILSPLRLRAAPPFTLSVPFSDRESAEATAAASRERFGQYRDIRGQPVLSASRAVSESPWTLVVNLDRAEAFSEWGGTRFWVWISALAIFLGVTGAGVAWWRHTSARHYRDLSDRDARYRALLQQTQEAVAAELQGRLVFASPALARMFGYPDDSAILGKPFHLLFAPEWRETVTELRASLLEDGSGLDTCEVVGLSADGSRFDVEVKAAALRIDGELGLEATLRDITLRKKVEKDLRESEQRYRALFEGNPQPMWVYDLQTLAFLAVNEAACRHYGYSREEFLKMTIRDIRPAEDLPALLQEVERARRGVDLVRVWRHRKRDGTLIDVEATTHSLSFAARPARLALLQDVTERRRAEERLRKSEERFQLVARATNDAIWDWDLITNEHSWGDGFFVLFGYGREIEELGIESWYRGIHPEEKDRVISGIRTVIDGSETKWSDEYRFRRADGSFAQILDRGWVIRNSAGKPVRMIGAMMDVSDRKRLEQQLIQSQKMEAVGRLAGGVAHDFNNLLTAISGYNELVLSQLPPGDPRRGHAEEIRRAADRAAGLTQQLLAYSRRQVLEPKVLDLNAVVASMEKMLRRLIGEDVELATMQQPGLWPVKADPGQLEQVVLNLAVNARDAMPQGGRLQIVTGNVAVDAASALSGFALVPGDYAVLTVADNGLGMTPEVKARLFEPFFTTKEKGKGTGLGLSTVYGIVKQSGGYVWVDSEPGRGTAFRVYLPRCHAEPDRLEPPPASPESTTAGSETILLVEDEPEVRNLVEKLLAMQGYTVLVAASPSEALQLCEKERRRIDLLLTDVVMPDMSGRELARRLEPSRPEMRVLYMSGYTEDAIGRHGVLDPEIAFLQKPFSPDALARKVREGLGATPGQLKNS